MDSLFRTAWLWPAAVCIFLGTSAAQTFAAGRDQIRSQGLPNFDKRETKAKPDRVLPDPQASAAAQLRNQVPDVRLDRHPLLGTIKHVTAPSGFLGGPNGEGRALPPRPGDGRRAKDPHRAIKDFLDTYQPLFGHGAEVLEQARLKREAVTAHNGLRTVVWEQRLDDIAIYEGVLVGNVSARDELISLSSQFVAQPERAADAGTPQRARLQTAPPISALDALVAALEILEEEVDPSQIVALTRNPEGNEQRQQFKVAILPGESRARLVWLPLTAYSLRLCWEVELTRRERSERYRVLVDALNREVLLRHRLTVELSDATFAVFTGDSPRPFSPGWPSPSTNQPPLVARSLVTLSALRTNASLIGWISEGENETRGNNVDAHLDRNGDDVPDLPRPQGSPFRVFQPPLDLGRDPAASGDAAVVQLFYWCNWAHDRLYELGFTEAAGNFQKDNFGRGGLGNDAIQADAQDGSGVNNANFTPTPDGEPGRIQMFLWDGPDPAVDGDFDAEIVLHEYVHGLSTRLVGGGVGITALQSAGMGEGWSDFYALSLLSEPDDDLEGTYAFGAYAVQQLGALKANYYFGIRRYPYCTDLSRSPLTLRDIDPLQISPHDGVPISPLFGFAPLYAGEVHSQGEVWCAMLWEARANLIRKHGFAGNELMLRLVTDGMKLSPPNPTFTQARDAILLADQIDQQGANYAELWTAFARRGLGFSASTPDPGTTLQVREAFDLPDTLVISSAAKWVSSGAPGGPFSAPCQTYPITNLSSQPLTWKAATPGSWLNITPAGGVLPAGGATNVAVCLTTNAQALAAGVYSGPITFSNALTGILQTRSAELTVMEFAEMPFRETFESGSLLPGWSISGTGPHRIQVTSLNEPHDGRYHVTLDSADGHKGRNELTLGVDLAGYTNVVLRFWAKSFGDEPDGPPPSPFIGGADFDGVAVSTDGVSWYEVQSLRSVPATYQEFVVDLDRAMAEHGLSFNHTVRIRFNQVDDYQIPFDGLAFDDISLEGVGRHRITVSVPENGVEGSGLLPEPGWVRIGSIATTPLDVRLTSTHPGKVKVPAFLTIPAGADQVPFPLTLADDSEVEGTVRVRIRADIPGFVESQADIRVIDNEQVALKVTLPPRAREGDGRLVRHGTVRLSRRPSQPVEVSLRSSDAARLTVPPAVTVPAGAMAASFDLVVQDDDRLDGDHELVVTAHVDNWSDGTGHIRILDNDHPALTVVLPPALGENIGLRSGAGSVRLSGRVPTNVLVTLFSSDPAQLRVPAAVEVEANLREAAFDLQTIDNSQIDGRRRIIITAQSAGFAAGTAGIDLADDETPPVPTQPMPANGATNVAIPIRLSWNPGVGNILVNGGFETGDFTGWTQINTGLGGWAINDGKLDPDGPEDVALPRQGRFSALATQLGGGSHQLYQDVFVPADALGATLRWTDQIRNHADHFASNQAFRVEIRATNDVLLAVAYATRLEDPLLNEWTSRAFDLSGFRGQTIRVTFTEMDNIGYLNVGLDEVSVSLTEPQVPTTYEVYLGLTPALSAAELLGSTTNAQWTLAHSRVATTYYWQVLARRGSASARSSVWSFATRGPGALHHFAWSPIASPQAINQPFAVTVTAQDDLGNTIQDFNGNVLVTGRPGSGTGSTVLITELEIGNNDRVEFMNVTRDSIDLSGWRISVYDAVSWPEPLTGVTLPPRTICPPLDLFRLNDNGEAPGQYPSFNAGTNINWSIADSGNPIAVLLQDATGQVVDFVCAGNAQPSLIAHPIPIPAEEWHGPPVVAALMFFNLSLQRRGQADSQTAADWTAAPITYGEVNPQLTVPFLPPPTVPLSTTWLTNFQHGVWTGMLAVSAPSAGLTLRASDGTNHVGTGNEFAVGVADDLMVTINAFPDVVLLGETLAYQIVVTNTGPHPATGVMLTNDLPPNAHFVQAEASSGACVNAEQRVICPVGTLAVGDSAHFTIVSRAIESGLATNCVSVNRAEADGYVLNNRSLAISTFTGPAISTTNLVFVEGSGTTNVAQVSVRLSAPSPLPVSVHYATSNGTAIAGQDYLPVSGTLTFAPGVTNLFIGVPIVGDFLDEGLETVLVRLSEPTNGVLIIDQARIRIQDDDPTPGISVGDVQLAEGPAGGTNEMVFDVSLSAPSGLQASVDFTTEDRTASAPTDYLTTFGRLVFPPGTTHQTVRVPVLGDNRYEGDETFAVVLSNPLGATLAHFTAIGTILDDDEEELSRFVWSPIPSPQYLDQPFLATLTALNGRNQPATAYAGTVTLRGVAESREIIVGGETNTWEFPMATHYHDARTQAIYLPEELGGPARLTALSLELVTLPAQVLTNWTIRLRHTLLRTYAEAAWENEGWTTVYQNDETVAGAGWVTFLFEQPFFYDGTNALLVDFSFNNSSYTDNALARSTPTPNARALIFQTDSAFGDPLLWSSRTAPRPSPVAKIPNTRFLAELPVNLEPSGPIQLSHGAWNGFVTVHESAASVSLRASDRQGHIATGNRFAVESTLDLDDDGLPDSWELRYFGSLEFGPEDDPDGDGVDNLDEFRAGTAPNDPASVTRIDQVFVRGGDVVIRFRASSGKTYQIERSDDFPVRRWTSVQADLHGDGQDVEVTDAGAAERTGYYRLVVGVDGGVK